MGQLKGVSGAYEWGLQAGTGTGPYVRFSDLRSEIHGTRLSLYAGDGGRMQVSAVDVVFYRTGSASSTLLPDADATAVNVETTGANYFSTVNEGTAAPNHNTYIANTPNMSGAVFLGLSNPAAFTSIFRVDIRAALRSTGLTNDTVSLYGQVFAMDMVTPLTGEVLLSTRTANSTATATVTAPHEGYGTVTAADWNGARLRLRWEYAINANEEAIRLDPSIPSLAIGNPLPTAADGGGDGLWVGLNSGVYKLRLGKANGVGLHWTGSAVELRNSNNVPTITLDASGNSRFDGPMTIGLNGGIWQGTGSFASPTTGLKLYNASGIGRLSTYNAGLEQITLNTSGQLVAGAGALIIDRAGLKIVSDGNGFSGERAITWETPDSHTLAIVAADAGSFTGQHFMITGLGIYEGPGGTDVYTGLDMSYRADGTVGANWLNLTSMGTVAISAPSSVSLTGSAIALNADTKVGGGLSVGNTTAAPAAGRILIKASTGATTVPAGCALLYLEDSPATGNKQELWVKFADGTYVKLAGAATA